MSLSTEWGDIPSSRELFGDDLIEMYSSANIISSLLDEIDSSSDDAHVSVDDDLDSHEDDVSDGMLVAMNAAAMDGAKPFGSSTAFSLTHHSTDSTDYQSGDTAALTAEYEDPPFTDAAGDVKRSITTTICTLPAPSKKLKASPAVYAVTAPSPASVVARFLPSPSNISPTNDIKPPVTGSANTVIPALIRSAPLGSMKIPTGGLTHQVNGLRPPAVPYSSTHGSNTRIPTNSLPTLTAAAKAAGMIPQPQIKPNEVGSFHHPTRAVTEADFKNVASAAVSCLMQSASNAGSESTTNTTTLGNKPHKIEKIDTSTAHVHALTSQSWVSANSPLPPSITSAFLANDLDKASRNARRAGLTQEERAKQNRDRNREHARNTRLRKKAYVEELKRTLTEIVTQRDAAEVKSRHAAQREREQREVRFRVMEEFLKLRGRNELNSARWVAILEEGFTFTLPKTHYRQMVDGSKVQVQNSEDEIGNLGSNLEQVLRGAAAVMEDSKYLSDFLQRVGGNLHTQAPPHHIQIMYKCDRKRFFMDSNITFIDYAATTVGAVERGLLNEIVFKGSMRATFSPASNKLISIDLFFDTGVISSQLDQLENSGSIDAFETDAAAVAHMADALLDSLQMPQIFVDTSNGPASISSDDGFSHN